MNSRIHIRRTSSSDTDFVALVAELDRYLAEVDGDEHAYYAQFNHVDTIPNVVVAYDESNPVGCGAFKPYADGAAEIKRMYVRPEFRGRKIGELILAELESWAADEGYSNCILETGHKQIAAVRLYQNSGYQVIPNYGQYEGIENSVCMKKSIAAEHATV